MKKKDQGWWVAGFSQLAGSASSAFSLEIYVSQSHLFDVTEDQVKNILVLFELLFCLLKLLFCLLLPLLILLVPLLILLLISLVLFFILDLPFFLFLLILLDLHLDSSDPSLPLINRLFS